MRLPSRANTVISAVGTAEKALKLVSSLTTERVSISRSCLLVGEVLLGDPARRTTGVSLKKSPSSASLEGELDGRGILAGDTLQVELESSLVLLGDILNGGSGGCVVASSSKTALS